jgi:hypothetical protein
MVSKRKMMLGAIVAVFAFSAITVASASATEFVFNKTGTLKGSALTSPTFASPGAGAAWECTKEKITGTVTVLKTATQKVTVQYEGCSLLGMLLTATPAEYELNTTGA